MKKFDQVVGHFKNLYKNGYYADIVMDKKFLTSAKAYLEDYMTDYDFKEIVGRLENAAMNFTTIEATWEQRISYSYMMEKIQSVAEKNRIKYMAGTITQYDYNLSRKREQLAGEMYHEKILAFSKEIVSFKAVGNYKIEMKPKIETRKKSIVEIYLLFASSTESK